MIANFREVFIITFFTSHLRKLKLQKFCCPRVKRTNRVSILAYFYTAAYKSVSASVPLTAITEVIQNAAT